MRREVIAVGVDRDPFLYSSAVLTIGAKQRKWIPELDRGIARDQFVQDPYMSGTTRQQFIPFPHESCLT